MDEIVTGQVSAYSVCHVFNKIIFAEPKRVQQLNNAIIIIITSYANFKIFS